MKVQILASSSFGSLEENFNEFTERRVKVIKVDTHYMPETSRTKSAFVYHIFYEDLDKEIKPTPTPIAGWDTGTN